MPVVVLIVMGMIVCCVLSGRGIKSKKRLEDFKLIFHHGLDDSFHFTTLRLLVALANP
jgi:hypothetical protein